MKAKLNGIYSPDLPGGWEVPEDPTDCWVVIHADIGSGGPGMDSFTLYVTTPKFLSRSLETDFYQLGRGLLVLNEFEWDVVENAVKAVCEEAVGSSWAEVAIVLSRYFLYEYE